MKALVSFIIPVHNAAGTIEQTVKSIMQDIKEEDSLEILIVENGSTDNSLQVAQRLQGEIPFVKVFQSPKGASCARNKGIQEASGEWLVFLDADDEFVDGAVPILFEDARNPKADICFYGHINGKENRPVCDNGVEQFFDGEEIDACRIMMLSNPTRYLQVWAKLIRRNLVVENHIAFNENLRLAEDSDFMLKCMEKANRIAVKKESVYHYVISSSSTIRSFDGSKVKDYMTSMQETKRGISLDTEALEKAYCKYVLLHFNIAMVRELFCENNKQSFWNKVQLMKTTFKGSFFADAAKKIPAKECLSVRMSAILCIKMNCYFGAGVIYWLRAKQNSMRENSK